MAKRTLENTGTCSCCGQNVKLGYQAQVEKIGYHGFKRPRGWQATIGRCFGYQKDPLEVSPEGLYAAIDGLKSSSETWQREIDLLRSGEIKEISRQSGWETRTFTLAHPQWGAEKAERIRKLEGQIREANRAIPGYEKQILDWQPRPLPGTTVVLTNAGRNS